MRSVTPEFLRFTINWYLQWPQSIVPADFIGYHGNNNPNYRLASSVSVNLVTYRESLRYKMQPCSVFFFLSPICRCAYAFVQRIWVLELFGRWVPAEAVPSCQGEGVVHCSGFQ